VILLAAQNLDTALTTAQAEGIHVRHIFPPTAFNGVGNANFSLADAEIYTTTIDLNTTTDWSASAKQAANAWNSLLAPPITTRSAQALDAHPLQANDFVDAFSAPEPDLPRQTLSTAADDLRPNYYESSQFMIGSISVGIVFLESDGTTDPSSEDWTDSEKSLVVSEVVNAMDWWAARENAAQISVVYDNLDANTAPTAVEPITRPYSDQQYWISDAMTAMGFDSDSYFDQVRKYNDYLRNTYHTDWAFTIFVVNSENDADNRFSDNYFAYAYLGGPFLVVTSGNNGYGPTNMDAVVTHEVGHIFRALDQYSSANVACDATSGYLQIENQNSQQGCAIDEDSIMRGQISPFANGQVDTFARGQIGWWDADSNGVLDPVDVGLSVTNVLSHTEVQTNVLTFSGHFAETPVSSPKYDPILINSVQNVNYKVDNGAWIAVDGTFGDYQGNFTFTTDALSGGTHDIYLQTIDDFGKVNETLIATVSVAGSPASENLDTQFDAASDRLTVQSANAQTFDGDAFDFGNGELRGVEYRLDGGEWQSAQATDGAFDSDTEAFSITMDIATLNAGDHLLEARAVDSQGNVDTTPAALTLTVQSAQYHVFLPLVLR